MSLHILGVVYWCEAGAFCCMFMFCSGLSASLRVCQVDLLFHETMIAASSGSPKIWPSLGCAGLTFPMTPFFSHSTNLTCCCLRKKPFSKANV